MTYSLVAHAAATGSAGGGPTGAVNATGADLFVAVLSYYAGFSVAPTPSDSSSNTWTQVATSQAGGNTVVSMWYVAAPTVTSSHTFSFSGTFDFAAMEIQVWSGSAASPLDQTNQAAAVQPGSVTPSQDNELLITGIAPNDSANTSAVDSGFTISDNNAYAAGTSEAGAAAYLVETTAAAKNPTWTVSLGTTPGTIIATFKASASAAVYTPYNPWPLWMPVLSQ